MKYGGYQARLDKFEIYCDLVNCFYNNQNATVIVVDNKDCFFPYQVKRDIDVFDYEATWIGKSDYIPNTKDKIEWDLYFNYYPVYSTKEARDLYIKTGEVTNDLFFGAGTQTPVKRTDVENFRKIKLDAPSHYRWYLKKKEYIPDPNINKVYTIQHLKEPLINKLQRLQEELLKLENLEL